MSNIHSNRRIFSSLFWKLMESGGVQGVGFLVSIVLARVLTPDEFGVIALVTIFITLANVFVQSGFNVALIQKKDADNLDFSSVLYFSIAVAFFLNILIYMATPFISTFYGEPILTPVLRVLSIILYFGAINSVQVAIVSRNLEFKKLFFSSIGAVIISGVIGITLAYRGFGVWALVGQQITNQLFTTLIMWFTVKWRPELVFSYKRLKSLLSFGYKILIAALFDSLYLNLRSLTIGKIYSSEMVGYYNRGKQFPAFIVGNIDSSIQSVMLPTYSAHQDNKKRIKEMVRRSIVTSSFLIFPIMAGLIVVSEPLITILLTDKWLPSVPILNIYCLVYAIRPLQTANIQAIKGMGYSGVFLRLEFVNKLIGIFILLISIPFGVLAIVWGVFVYSLISLILYAYPNIKILSYNLKEQLMDVMPSLLITIIMAGLVSLLKVVNVEPIYLIILQTVLGIIIYIILAKLSKIEAFNYLINTFKGFIREK